MSHSKFNLNKETGELEEINDNFIQFYKDNLPLIMEMTKDNPTALRLFFWLIQHMDKRNALVVSQQALSEALNISRTTIYTCILYLTQKQAIKIVKSGTSNIYAINTEICWKDSAENKKFATFSASVYVVQSEQDTPDFRTRLIGFAEKKPKRKAASLKNNNVNNFEEEQS